MTIGKPGTEHFRGHLYAIFGNDIAHLPADLEFAARHHRELAAHLRNRQPDGLITELGARHLADGHDVDADRCNRIAALVRRALDETSSDPEPGHTTPGRRPRVVVATRDINLRSALDTAGHHTRADVVHYGQAPKARKAAATAAMLIVGVDMAHWFTTPITASTPTVVIGFEPIDRAAAAEHAQRLDADLFILQPPGQDTLIALLRNVCGQAGAPA